MSGLVPYQLNAPIGMTAKGEPVLASRAFIDYLMVQFFNFVGGDMGVIPPSSTGGDGVSTTTFYREDGTYAVPDYPTGADPATLVGLLAIAGTSAHFMRADAAPAIDQGISPTWTQTHTFNQGLGSSTFIAAAGEVSGGTVKATLGFGCNGKTPQAAATVSAALSGTAGAAYGAPEQAILNNAVILVNQIRAALVANGIAA